MKRTFTVEYLFTSTRAYGDPIVHSRTIKARTAEEALNIAGLIGFTEFGERFTENCIDWQLTGKETGLT